MKQQVNHIANLTLTFFSIAVVSLNDSDELTSAESEDEEESGDENVEDSGSEVEIIEEVKGNGRSNHQSGSALYLEELPPHEQYLQEQAEAVFSLVTPDEQLKVSASLMSQVFAYSRCLEQESTEDRQKMCAMFALCRFWMATYLREMVKW